MNFNNNSSDSANTYASKILVQQFDVPMDYLEGQQFVVVLLNCATKIQARVPGRTSADLVVINCIWYWAYGLGIMCAMGCQITSCRRPWRPSTRGSSTSWASSRESSWSARGLSSSLACPDGRRTTSAGGACLGGWTAAWIASAKRKPEGINSWWALDDDGKLRKFRECSAGKLTILERFSLFLRNMCCRFRSGLTAMR